VPCRDIVIEKATKTKTLRMPSSATTSTKTQRLAFSRQTTSWAARSLKRRIHRSSFSALSPTSTTLVRVFWLFTFLTFSKFSSFVLGPYGAAGSESANLPSLNLCGNNIHPGYVRPVNVLINVRKHSVRLVRAPRQRIRSLGDSFKQSTMSKSV